LFAGPQTETTDQDGCRGAIVVVTSFNWLSFKGDPQMPFRDERGMLVTIPETVEEIF
jgi:hypothetical protein